MSTQHRITRDEVAAATRRQASKMSATRAAAIQSARDMGKRAGRLERVAFKARRATAAAIADGGDY